MTGSVEIAKTALEKIREEIDRIEMLPDAQAAARTAGLVHVVGGLCDVLAMLVGEAK